MPAHMRTLVWVKTAPTNTQQNTTEPNDFLNVLYQQEHHKTIRTEYDPTVATVKRKLN